MKLGIIGLGKMGLAIGYRALKGGHQVIGFNHSEQAIKSAEKLGIKCVKKIEELPSLVDVIWIMVPVEAVDQVLQELHPHLKKKQIIVDGGNSFFKDSMRRAQELETKDLFYLDCGTSGGLDGKEIGFSLMIGGSKKAYETIKPLLQAIAAPRGCAHMGASGTGHYVKMVHNGIEYALMQAYAEGFNLLKNGHFKDINLEVVSGVWNHGSIIRSWLLQLCQEIFAKDQNFDAIVGKVSQTGMGKWTVQEAREHNIQLKLIEDAVKIRDESEKTGGDYATKLVALLRNRFGGHPLEFL